MPNFPVTNQIYTIEELHKLTLRDIPFLMVNIPKVGWLPIQTFHISKKDIITSLTNTQWRYSRTNWDCIPIFHAIDSELLLSNYLDLNHNPANEEEFTLSIKGHPVPY